MDISKVISLHKLAEESDVPYYSLYRKLIGATKAPLSVKERTNVINALSKAIKPLAKELGFEVAITRTAD